MRRPSRRRAASPYDANAAAAFRRLRLTWLLYYESQTNPLRVDTDACGHVDTGSTTTR
jgi:hypothetical protein